MKRIAMLAGMLTCFSIVFAGNNNPGGTLQIRVTGDCVKCEVYQDGSVLIACDDNPDQTCFKSSGGLTTVGCPCKDPHSGSRFYSFTFTGGYTEEQTDRGTVHLFKGVKVIE